MNSWAETAIVFLMLANLTLLGSSRLGFCIRVVALQGIAVAFFTLFSHLANLSIHVLLLAAMTAALKGLIFPRLLFRTLERTEVRREMEPLVGYSASILSGIAMLAAAWWFSAHLPVTALSLSPLVLPAALWTIFVGLFLIVARRKAISQVLGYLVLENGIFAFGAALAGDMPLLVEMGCLLDVFMAVFVMGLAIFHISREFDHIDTDRLSALKD